MKVLRNYVRFLGIFMTVLMLVISIPYQSVLAALIGTELVQDSIGGRAARDQIQVLFVEIAKERMLCQNRSQRFHLANPLPFGRWPACRRPPEWRAALR